MSYLIQKQWYRNLFSCRTFLLTDRKWIIDLDFRKGMKVERVDGKWNNLVFCKCGNEMVHTNSFIGQRKVNDNYIFDYKCSFCETTSHYNPDIIPGLLKCDVNGIPIKIEKRNV